MMNEENKLSSTYSHSLPCGVVSHSDCLDQFFTALAKFQGEVTMPEKNAKGNWGAYADITEIVECIRPTLSKHGLSYMQPPIVRNEQGDLGIVTWIGHSSGQWVRTIFVLKPEKDTNQGIGGSITYLRRYALSAALGLASDEDNDGNEIMMNNMARGKNFDSSKPISDKQKQLLLMRLKNKPSGTIAKLVDRFSISKIEDLTMSNFNDVLAWVDEQ